MKIVVITNKDLKEELLAQGLADNANVDWQEEFFPVNAADAYIDLLYDGSAERINALKKLQPAVIIVNAVYFTGGEMPADFIRINGWKSFLQRPLVEAGMTVINKKITENIFAGFNKKVEWVPSVPGFITARVISMIINEAYFTLDENVSTKEEIDTAMKLGTNYPYGPFEWGSVIGLKNVYDLLTALTKTNSRYTPSDLLKKEALLS
jgi:3-hydroxybutyryl-CoA dehydrogenase